MKRPCCNHDDKRHLLIGGTGRNGATGEYLCLTGKCKCGMRQVKPQGRARRGKPKVESTKHWDEL